jgi:hypothetical protein
MTVTAFARRHLPLRGYALSLEDVQRLFDKSQNYIERFREESRALWRVELSNDPSPIPLANQDVKSEAQAKSKEAQIEQQLKQLDDWITIWISLFLDSGEEVFSTGSSVLPLKGVDPKRIRRIVMSSLNPWRHAFSGQEPKKGVEFILDTAATPFLDWQQSVSSPTPVNSYVSVRGEPQLANALFKELEDELAGKQRGFTFIHRAFVYDLGLWVFGVPVIFSLVRVLIEMPVFKFDEMGNFDRVFLIAFASILLLWAYRFVIAYAKWAFPVIELAGTRPKLVLHRTVLAAIGLGLLGNIVWQVILPIGSIFAGLPGR